MFFNWEERKISKIVKTIILVVVVVVSILLLSLFLFSGNTGTESANKKSISPNLANRIIGAMTSGGIKLGTEISEKLPGQGWVRRFVPGIPSETMRAVTRIFENWGTGEYAEPGIENLVSKLTPLAEKGGARGAVRGFLDQRWMPAPGTVFVETRGGQEIARGTLSEAAVNKASVAGTGRELKDFNIVVPRGELQNMENEMLGRFNGSAVEERYGDGVKISIPQSEALPGIDAGTLETGVRNDVLKSGKINLTINEFPEWAEGKITQVSYYNPETGKYLGTKIADLDRAGFQNMNAVDFFSQFAGRNIPEDQINKAGKINNIFDKNVPRVGYAENLAQTQSFYEAKIDKLLDQGRITEANRELKKIQDTIDHPGASLGMRKMLGEILPDLQDHLANGVAKEPMIDPIDLGRFAAAPIGAAGALQDSKFSDSLLEEATAGLKQFTKDGNVYTFDPDSGKVTIQTGDGSKELYSEWGKQGSDYTPETAKGFADAQESQKIQDGRGSYESSPYYQGDKAYQQGESALTSVKEINDRNFEELYQRTQKAYVSALEQTLPDEASREYFRNYVQNNTAPGNVPSDYFEYMLKDSGVDTPELRQALQNYEGLLQRQEGLSNQQLLGSLYSIFPSDKKQGAVFTAGAAAGMIGGPITSMAMGTLAEVATDKLLNYTSDQNVQSHKDNNSPFVWDLNNEGEKLLELQKKLQDHDFGYKTLSEEEVNKIKQEISSTQSNMAEIEQKMKDEPFIYAGPEDPPGKDPGPDISKIDAPAETIAPAPSQAVTDDPGSWKEGMRENTGEQRRVFTLNDGGKWVDQNGNEAPKMYAGDPPEIWTDMPQAPGQSVPQNESDEFLKNNYDNQVISGSDFDTTLGLLEWDEGYLTSSGSISAADAGEQAPGYPAGWTYRGAWDPNGDNVIDPPSDDPLFYDYNWPGKFSDPIRSLPYDSSSDPTEIYIGPEAVNISRNIDFDRPALYPGYLPSIPSAKNSIGYDATTGLGVVTKSFNDGTEETATKEIRIDPAITGKAPDNSASEMVLPFYPSEASPLQRSSVYQTLENNGKFQQSVDENNKAIQDLTEKRQAIQKGLADMSKEREESLGQPDSPENATKIADPDQRRKELERQDRSTGTAIDELEDRNKTIAEIRTNAAKLQTNLIEIGGLGDSEADSARREQLEKENSDLITSINTNNRDYTDRKVERAVGQSGDIDERIAEVKQQLEQVNSQYTTEMMHPELGDESTDAQKAALDEEKAALKSELADLADTQRDIIGLQLKQNFRTIDSLDSSIKRLEEDLQNGRYPMLKEETERELAEKKAQRDELHDKNGELLDKVGSLPPPSEKDNQATSEQAAPGADSEEEDSTTLAQNLENSWDRLLKFVGITQPEIKEDKAREQRQDGQGGDAVINPDREKEVDGYMPTPDNPYIEPGGDEVIGPGHPLYREVNNQDDLNELKRREVERKMIDNWSKIKELHGKQNELTEELSRETDPTRKQELKAELEAQKSKLEELQSEQSELSFRRMSPDPGDDEQVKELMEANKDLPLPPRPDNAPTEGPYVDENGWLVVPGGDKTLRESEEYIWVPQNSRRTEGDGLTIPPGNYETDPDGKYTFKNYNGGTIEISQDGSIKPVSSGQSTDSEDAAVGAGNNDQPLKPGGTGDVMGDSSYYESGDAPVISGGDRSETGDRMEGKISGPLTPEERRNSINVNLENFDASKVFPPVETPSSEPTAPEEKAAEMTITQEAPEPTPDLPDSWGGIGEWGGSTGQESFPVESGSVPIGGTQENATPGTDYFGESASPSSPGMAEIPIDLETQGKAASTGLGEYMTPNNIQKALETTGKAIEGAAGAVYDAGKSAYEKITNWWPPVDKNESEQPVQVKNGVGGPALPSAPEPTAPDGQTPSATTYEDSEQQWQQEALGDGQRIPSDGDRMAEDYWEKPENEFANWVFSPDAAPPVPDKIANQTNTQFPILDMPYTQNTETDTQQPGSVYNNFEGNGTPGSPLKNWSDKMKEAAYCFDQRSGTFKLYPDFQARLQEQGLQGGQVMQMPNGEELSKSKKFADRIERYENSDRPNKNSKDEIERAGDTTTVPEGTQVRDKDGKTEKAGSGGGKIEKDSGKSIVTSSEEPKRIDGSNDICED